MACLFQHFPHVRALMERGIIHHDNACYWQFWHEVLREPREEHITIHRLFKKTCSQKSMLQDGTNDVHPAFLVPVVHAAAACSLDAVPMGSGHIAGKAALIEIDDGSSFSPT